MIFEKNNHAHPLSITGFLALGKYRTEDNRLIKFRNNLFFIFRKILFSLVIISVLFSCGQAPNNNANSSSSLVEHVITEEILTEEILTEEILTEEILAEEVFTELIVFEEILEELVLTEEIMYEEYYAEYATIEDLANNKLLVQSMVPDIDWKSMTSKYAVGTSVIVFTAVLSVATINTPVACVFIKSFQGSVKGALSGAVVGAAIAGGIEAIKSKGDVNSIKKYALESSADGFMWGAIIGAVSGGLKGYGEYKNNFPRAKNILYTKNGNLGKIKGKGIYNSFENKIGYIEDIPNPQHVEKYMEKRNIKKIVYMYNKNGTSEFAGFLDDNNTMLEHSSKYFNYMRTVGIKEAWKLEKELVMKTGRGSYNWTTKEIEELIKTGKVKGFIGHHINSAKYSPNLAWNPDNIKFLTKEEHFRIAHNSNYRIPTYGKLINRTIK